jgi:hypothetical protein
MAKNASAGATKHAGLEGNTILECCDASVPVLSVWECLDAFLSSPGGTPRVDLITTALRHATLRHNQDTLIFARAVLLLHLAMPSRASEVVSLLASRDGKHIDHSP